MSLIRHGNSRCNLKPVSELGHQVEGQNALRGQWVIQLAGLCDCSRTYKQRSTALPQSIKVEAEAAKDEKVVINIEDNEPEGSCVSTGTSNTAALTRDQQFKKEMAELRLRTQEQEFKAKEQELKALLMQKKHEALMAFLQSSEN